MANTGIWTHNVKQQPKTFIKLTPYLHKVKQCKGTDSLVWNNLSGTTIAS